MLREANVRGGANVRGCKLQGESLIGAKGGVVQMRCGGGFQVGGGGESEQRGNR